MKYHRIRFITSSLSLVLFCLFSIQVVCDNVGAEKKNSIKLVKVMLDRNEVAGNAISNVSPSPEFQVLFSQPLSEESLSSSFSLYKLDDLLEKNKDASIPLIVSQNNSNTLLTISPANDLQKNQYYTLLITNAQSSDSLSVLPEFQLKFSTSPITENKKEDPFKNGLTVKSYSGDHNIFGVAILDDIMEKNTPVLHVEGLPPQKLTGYRFGTILETKVTDDEGRITFYKEDLDVSKVFRKNDSLIIVIDGQEKSLAYYKPHQIRSWLDLHGMRKLLDEDYILIDNITLPTRGSRVNNTKGLPLSGFKPIGDIDNKFKGSFQGNNFIIENLYVHNEAHAGLFGVIETEKEIKNVTLAVASVISRSGSAGALAGILQRGSISRVFALPFSSFPGTITAIQEAGGLIGESSSVDTRIINSYATLPVKVNQQYAGGLIGKSMSTIANCYATGDITGANFVGGLVGENHGAIAFSYALGRIQVPETTVNYGPVVGAQGERSSTIMTYRALTPSIHILSGGAILELPNDGSIAFDNIETALPEGFSTEIWQRPQERWPVFFTTNTNAIPQHNTMVEGNRRDIK